MVPNLEQEVWRSLAGPLLSTLALMSWSDEGKADKPNREGLVWHKATGSRPVKKFQDSSLSWNGPKASLVKFDNFSAYNVQG